MATAIRLYLVSVRPLCLHTERRGVIAATHPRMLRGRPVHPTLRRRARLIVCTFYGRLIGEMERRGRGSGFRPAQRRDHPHGQARH
eukprot:2541134-Pleurochrysis_carterae.AAC.1